MAKARRKTKRKSARRSYGGLYGALNLKKADDKPKKAAKKRAKKAAPKKAAPKKAAPKRAAKKAAPKKAAPKRARKSSPKTTPLASRARRLTQLAAPHAPSKRRGPKPCTKCGLWHTTKEHASHRNVETSFSPRESVFEGLARPKSRRGSDRLALQAIAVELSGPVSPARARKLMADRARLLAKARRAR